MSGHEQDKKPSSVFGMGSSQLDQILALGMKDTGEDEPDVPPLSLQPFLERPGAQIGRYRLLRVLGEGGMGIVYLAEQEEPIRRHVALKVIKPGMDSAQVIARFEAERQALAMMDHPHVARVYDAGLTPSERPHFVMEYVEGTPITEHCDKHRLTVEDRLALFLHVCEAVQHAHQKGIIHRDLKPSNILVTIQDRESVPKVIDFGVARAISQPLTERTLYTEQGQLVGTPEYMSPEQAHQNSQDIDTRTDVYSLGVLLYELLTGALPFDRETFREGGIDHIRKVICERDPVTPSAKLSKTSVTEWAESAQKRQTDVRTLQRQLRGDLDWITLKAMEKERPRRYASVDAMATDIYNHLNNLPVTAAPPAALYRAKKFLQRHRYGTAVTCSVLILIVAVSWAIRVQIQATREHTRSEAIEHEQLLLQAQDAYGNGQVNDALARVDTLLTSAHIGRKAKLLHAQLLLDSQGPGSGAAELKRLLDTSDEVAGQAHFLLANIYYNGDPCAPGETRQYYQRWQQHREQAEQLIADTASYYFLRARAAYGVKEMLQMLAKALELDRQHYESLRERAQIYHSQYDYQKMARDAARMIGIRPDHPQGYALSALALQGLGRLDAALVDHTEAIRLAPQDPQFYDARRETLTRLEQYDLALPDAQICAQLRPRDLSYRHKLFAAYTALGRYDEAQHQYEHFLSYPILREHRLGGVPMYLRGIFCLFSSRLVADSVAANRPWHGPGEPPGRAPFAWMRGIDAYYRSLHTRVKRLVPKGFHPTFSPDGKRLAYSHGLLTASGVAVLDLENGHTELLTTSGRSPEWSPDGGYIAFERNRRIWSADSLANLSLRTWRPFGRPPTHAEEIWIVDMDTQEIRRICEGTCPRWGYRSGRLYYTSGPNNTLYSISPLDTDARPVEILTECGVSPVISPDERYVADHTYRELRIVDIVSREVIATWIAPPSPLMGLGVSWSPDSRELSIGGSNASEIGLWIYDVQTGQASQVLDRSWLTSRWAPDSSSMALTLGMFIEIVQVDLKPGLPTMASFDRARTRQEHCLELLERLNTFVAADPALLHAHYLRADCALWMGHPQVAEYLQQFEQALPPYNADDCAREAQRMLDATPQLRDKLLPLALLLVRKAVEKDPENADFLKTLGLAFLHSEDRENAEMTLLRAYDLATTTADTNAPQTMETAELLIQLYDSWDDPEEAAKWRAKSTPDDVAEESEKSRATD
jgi:serine/threonine protein kinase/Flp pilus assembly protein TadD